MCFSRCQADVNFVGNILKHLCRPKVLGDQWHADDRRMIFFWANILVEISLTKRETLSYLQNEHFVRDPCSEVAFPGEFQER